MSQPYHIMLIIIDSHASAALSLPPDDAGPDRDGDGESHANNPFPAEHGVSRCKKRLEGTKTERKHQIAATSPLWFSGFWRILDKRTVVEDAGDMRREELFAVVKHKLSCLAYETQLSGHLNLTDIHVHSEMFYAELLNKAMDLKLKDLNSERQNVEGIDLKDDGDKIVIQVSATGTREKIQTSLDKDLLTSLPGYHFIFLSIGDDKHRHKKPFAVPAGITFDQKKDILDMAGLLRTIQGLDLEHLRTVYDFVNDSLPGPTTAEMLPSDLAAVISALASRNLAGTSSVRPITRAFDIDRKIDYNKLKKARPLIEEYRNCSFLVDQIYEEMDRQGSDKAFVILTNIAHDYMGISLRYRNSDKVFDELLREGERQVIGRQDPKGGISIERLRTCVGIVIVNAFIRCKIFKRPPEDGQPGPAGKERENAAAR